MSEEKVPTRAQGQGGETQMCSECGVMVDVC